MFLVDSGSAVSVMPYNLFNQHFSSKGQCTAPWVKLMDCSKQRIPVHGCFVSEVMHMARTASILFYVVSQGNLLLGLDVIKALNLQPDGSSHHCLQTIPTAISSKEQCSAKSPSPLYTALPSHGKSSIVSLEMVWPKLRISSTMSKHIHLSKPLRPSFAAYRCLYDR